MHHPFLRIIVPCCALIPISIGIYNYRYLVKPSKIILYYLLFASITEYISGVLGAHHIPNLIILHFYTIAEFIFFSYFFKEVFTRSAAVKAVKILGIIFTLLCIANVVFFQKVNQFNTYTRSLEALLIIIYCLIYFEQESRVRQTLKWEKSANNLLTTSALLYFSGSFFLFLFSNIINKTVSLATLVVIWNLHGVFLVAMYLLIAIGFINERRNR